MRSRPFPFKESSGAPYGHPLSLKPVLLLIDSAATGRSAATASLLIGVERFHVINRYLFAWPYVSQRIEEYVPVDDLHVAVGLA